MRERAKRDKVELDKFFEERKKWKVRKNFKS